MHATCKDKHALTPIPSIERMHTSIYAVITIVHVSQASDHMHGRNTIFQCIDNMHRVNHVPTAHKTYVWMINFDIGQATVALVRQWVRVRVRVVTFIFIIKNSKRVKGYFSFALKKVNELRTLYSYTIYYSCELNLTSILSLLSYCSAV